MTTATEEAVLTTEDLRNYDHEKMTAEGGSLDKWNAIKENKSEVERSHQRIQNNREYINSIDARLYELEKRMQSNTQGKDPIVAMISNEY